MMIAPEEFRLTTGEFRTSKSDGPNGLFFIPTGDRKRETIQIIATDGTKTAISAGWEHISLKVATRTGKTRKPTWEEMCRVKDLFWKPEARVVQYHPPHSEYVNNHPDVLHLWRHPDIEFPHPPKYLV